MKKYVLSFGLSLAVESSIIIFYNVVQNITITLAQDLIFLWLNEKAIRIQ